MADVADRRILRRGLTLALAAMVLVFAPAAQATAPPPSGWAAWDLGHGVEHLLTERPGLVAHAARIPAGAPVALRPVIAFDRVGGGHAPDDGRQPVSELCRRVGGIVCVNADFFNCRTCGQAAGGLIDRTRPLRSFRPDHQQVSFVRGIPTLDPVGWVGTVRGHVGGDRFRMPLGSLNRGPLPGGAVLYTPDWGPTTPEVSGQVELVLAAGGPHHAGLTSLVPVAKRATAGAIPRDGVVIAGNGRAAEALNWLWQAWYHGKGPRQLLLDTALSAPADLSIGGHPILLRNGEAQPLDPNDPMSRDRHPRTLLGWTATGDVLIVTIDGRQPGYSDGATLNEATDLLRTLGVRDAINLDGGGSSTFAVACDLGACVANRPSDGHERPVAVALAVVPSQRSGVLRAAAATDASPAVENIAPPPPAPAVVAHAVTRRPPSRHLVVASTNEPGLFAAPPAVEPRVSRPSQPVAVDTSPASPARLPAAAGAVMAIAAWAACYVFERRRSHR